VEDVDLAVVLVAMAKSGAGMALTASEARVFGTATRISVDAAVGPGEAEQWEKEQKFMVLTSSMCSIHGCGRVSGEGSRGSLVLSRDSSSAVNFQTMSLLSLPWLPVSF
jgi:hypothetical protein